MEKGTAHFVLQPERPAASRELATDPGRAPARRIRPRRTITATTWWAFFIVLLLVAGVLPAQPSPENESARLYIVRLAEPGAVELLAGRTFPGASLLRAPGSREQLLQAAAAIETAQDRWISEHLQDPQLEVVGRATRVANQLFIRGPADKVALLAEAPGVEGVYPAAERALLLDAAPQQMHVDALWSALGGSSQSGAGVKIGILDTGIALDHPMFGDTSMTAPPGYPRGDAPFTNGKVIVARSFHELFPFPPTTAEDQTPEDQNGHGTAVAAIAAGSPALSPQAGVIRGVAPRAWIGNYKIFGTGPNDVTTTAAVIAAVDQAVADGMDVLNLSLGGPPPTDPNDPELEAIRNAVAAGVLVVAAAGNEGPGPNTISSPAIAPEAIAVGAVTHGRKFAALLQVEAPDLPQEVAEIGYVPGSGVSLSTGFGPFPLSSLTDLDPTRQACLRLPAGKLTGTVALVRRGECFFQVKLENVSAAGAQGMIVYDNVDGPEVIMALDNPVIPAVFIARKPGEALQDLVDRLPPSSVRVRLEPSDQLHAVPALGDQIADFSSRGPGYDGAVKPDLVAVGSTILSADAPDGFTFSLNGTSFAAPMVAGAAALLRQLHPDWTPGQIKSALLTTAAPVVTRKDGSPAGVYDAGAGRMDLSQIADVRLAVDPPIVNFFPQAGINAGPKRIVVTNLAAENLTLRVGFETLRADPGLAIFAEPERLIVGPGGEETIEARCSVAADMAGGELEGRLLLVDEEREVTLRVAVRCLALGEGPGRVLQVAQSGAVIGAFDSIQSALAVARPGDTIEITDRGPYREVLLIERTTSGLELDGLVIRSTGGSPAILDGSEASGNQPVIDVVGAEGVHIENLDIREGEMGIRFRSGASGVVQECRVSSRRPVFFAYGIEVREGSRALIVDSVVDNGGGSGIGVRDKDSQALVIGSRFGGESGQRPLEYHGVHVANGGSAVLMGNTIFAGGGAREQEQHGALVESGNLALLQGNRVARNDGPGAGVFLDQGSLESVASVFEDHLGSGLQAEPWSDFHLDFDLFRRNGAAGIHSSSSTGTVSRTAVENNGLGIQFTSGSLTLENSLITFSGQQGIVVDEPWQLVLRHLTVAENGGEGLSGAAGGLGLMVGSIFYGNRGTDVAVTGFLSTRDSLVGEAQGLTPAAGFALLSGQAPLFAAPSQGDFRLLPGSPAIDLVKDSTSSGATDFTGHVRSVDGDGDGESLPDAGALETGSSFAPPLVAPNAAREGWFTGLAFTNTWTRQDDMGGGEFLVQIQGFAADGRAVGDASLPVSRESQTARLSEELVAGSPPDWLLIRPEHPFVKGFALEGDTNLTRLDGTVLRQPLDLELVALGLTDREMVRRIRIVNPNPVSTTVAIHGYPSRSGEIRFETLPPFGSVAFAVGDLGAAAQCATFHSLEGLPLAGFSEIETPEALAVLPALAGTDFGPELYGAQLAITSGVRSRLELFTWMEGVTVTIEAHGEAGERVAQQTVHLERNLPFAADVGELLGLSNFVGWLRVVVADPSHEVSGAVVFGAPDGRFLAALPLQPEDSGGRVSVFSHVAHGDATFTGITLLNPGVEPALYALEVYDPAGNLLGRSLGELCAGCKRAQVLPEWVPELEAQWGGWIRLRSSRRLLGFELFGNGEYLAAVPQQVVVP